MVYLKSIHPILYQKRDENQTKHSLHLRNRFTAYLHIKNASIEFICNDY